MFDLAILVVFVPILIAAFLIFDRLVRLEYASYRDAWIADGKPHGFFWMPAESKSAGGWFIRFRSSIAMQRLTFGWLFSTPEWMQKDKKALRLAFWLRVTVLTWNLGMLGVVTALIFF